MDEAKYRALYELAGPEMANAYRTYLESRTQEPAPPRERWEDNLMVHDWPEMGPGSLSVEDLYQMFKKRLAEETSGA